MEENENENENSNQFNSNIPSKIETFSHAPPHSHTDPLFSSIITLCILILLYFPHLFFKLIFSPVLILTLTLLLTLLRFGATQRHERTETKKHNESDCTTFEADQISDSNVHDHQDHKWVACTETSTCNSDPRFEDSFVEWNVRAPLEVIYEAHEEGEEEEEGNKDPSRFGIERYPSLSLYYPETDSDTSSEGDFQAIGEWGSPKRWEDEDREGLIEIALDGVNSSCSNNINNNNNNNKRDLGLDFVGNFHGEEENNLIEIDISAVQHDEKWRYSGEN